MARTRWRAATLLAVSVWLMQACQTGGAGAVGDGGADRPMPAPVPAPPTRLPEGRDKLIEVARRQPYDINPGASARAELEDGSIVTIEPQDGTYRLADGQLASGRVVARFINNGDKPVKRYGLPARGTSYWVVYQGAKGEWLSAVIADSRSSELDRIGVKTTVHQPSRPWRQSIAQWQLPEVLLHSVPGGDTPRELAFRRVAPWVSCKILGCCVFDPDDPPPPQ